jgi:hypothetical protein
VVLSNNDGCVFAQSIDGGFRLAGVLGHGWGIEISEFRQIANNAVGCYLQPLKMALLDDICRFLNFQRHRGDVAGFANAWPRRRQMRQLPVEQRPVAGDPIEYNPVQNMPAS